jgi:hypothetical protein
VQQVHFVMGRDFWFRFPRSEPASIIARAMEIDPEKFKTILARMIADMKALETELLTYRVLVASLNSAHVVSYDLFEALEKTKTPSLIAEIDHKYEPWERLPQLVDQAALDQEVARLLESWRPKGPPN